MWDVTNMKLFFSIYILFYIEKENNWNEKENKWRRHLGWQKYFILKILSIENVTSIDKNIFFDNKNLRRKTLRKISMGGLLLWLLWCWQFKEIIEKNFKKNLRKT